MRRSSKKSHCRARVVVGGRFNVLTTTGVPRSVPVDAVMETWLVSCVITRRLVHLPSLYGAVRPFLSMELRVTNLLAWVMY